MAEEVEDFGPELLELVAVLRALGWSRPVPDGWMPPPHKSWDPDALPAGGSSSFGALSDPALLDTPNDDAAEIRSSREHGIDSIRADPELRPVPGRNLFALPATRRRVHARPLPDPQPDFDDVFASSEETP